MTHRTDLCLGTPSALVPYQQPLASRALISGATSRKDVSIQLGPVATAVSPFINFVVNAQHHVLRQNSKPLAFVPPSDLLNAHDLPIRFHSCFALNSGEHGQEDLEADLDSPRGARAGEDERANFADIPSSTFTPSYRPAIHPPKHRRRLQGKPHDFSAVSRRIHPSPRLRPLE